MFFCWTAICRAREVQARFVGAPLDLRRASGRQAESSLGYCILLQL